MVDDEKPIRRLLRMYLDEGGYTVTEAADGAEALSKMRDGGIDLVLLDLMLPEVDGLEVCRRIRDDHPGVPVIMLTARSTTEDRVQGLDLGADDYLPKPFHFEELAARLRSILRRSSTEKSTKLVCSDLTLDLVSHYAYRGEKEIELTTKEYALLEYMMRNKDRILSRSMIMQHVWKHDFDPESNIIDVYIKRVRQKIERPGQSQLIHSIRGVGYRMREAGPMEESEDE